jgi:hypothetical protein
MLGMLPGVCSKRLQQIYKREGLGKETMYDLIGDIHGYADALTNLLEQLGYELVGGAYRHPNRKVIFLGDFIDRGPKIRQVLEIVRPMVEGGHALSVLGNHELNALAFHTEDRSAPGKHLRLQTDPNTKQHQATLEQLSPEELRSYLDWFRTIPLWLELDGLRAVHACWDEPSMQRIANACSLDDGLTDEFLHDACRKGASLFEPVEIVLKGKEGKLPSGMSFGDKDGNIRTKIRTRWYLDARGRTYRTYALQSNEIDCDLELDESVMAAARPYPEDAKPVFFGHYWLSATHPAVLAHNVACLDFSVAKNGFLCAYRWNGEKTLNNENFVWSA